MPAPQEPSIRFAIFGCNHKLRYYQDALTRAPKSRGPIGVHHNLRHSAGGQDLSSMTARSCFISVGPITCLVA